MENPTPRFDNETQGILTQSRAHRRIDGHGRVVPLRARVRVMAPQLERPPYFEDNVPCR